MATVQINNPDELQTVLNGVLDKLLTLQAESIVNAILAQHAVVLAVRGAADPQKRFEDIRESFRRDIGGRTKFEGGNDELNALLVKRALDIHEKIFEEMRKALGQPTEFLAGELLSPGMTSRSAAESAHRAAPPAG